MKILSQKCFWFCLVFPNRINIAFNRFWRFSKIPTVNSPPQQPDDFGYVNNRPKVLRVTNFHNLYLYISVHITIKKNNSTIIVYSPKCLSLLTSCSGRNFNCNYCFDGKFEGLGLNRFGGGPFGGGGGSPALRLDPRASTHKNSCHQTLHNKKPQDRNSIQQRTYIVNADVGKI